jgi:hypothetical protein
MEDPTLKDLGRARSVASLMLTTEALAVERPQEEGVPPGVGVRGETGGMGTQSVRREPGR